MKILIVGNNSIGLYNFRKHLISKLIESGVDVNIITPDNGFIDELKKIGCNVDLINMDRRGKNIFQELKLLMKYKNFIKKYNPDKVVAYTIKPNIYCGLISRIYNIEFFPNITGVGSAFQRDGILKSLIINIYKIAFKNVKKIFFENINNKKVFIESGICSKDNSLVLSGAGVDLSEYNFEELPSFESIKFLFIGRIMKEKGIDELLQAIKIIKSKYENVSFNIIGGLEEAYTLKIDQFKSKGLLNYPGRVKNVKTHIRESHCILLPSYHEGMSNALLEGAAMGRALITSNIHGCKEVVEDNKNGFLHNVKDVNDLVEKIEKFILLKEDEKIAFGKESRRIVEEKFNKKDVVDKTLKNILGNE